MNTIPQAFIKSATNNPENPCLIYKDGHTFGEVTYRRLLNLVENFTLSLEKLGVKKGDRVVILSENRPEWVVSDLSAISLGAIFAPIHTTLTADQIKEIILEIDPKVIIVSEKRMLAKLIGIKKEIEKKVMLLYYNVELKEDLSEFKNDKCHFIEALKLMPHDNHSELYRDLIADIDQYDTASIIFTIGPNGKYRGVELSHKNIISNAEGTLGNVYIRPDDKFLSILPLSHAFEQMAGYYIPLMQGASIAYLTDIAKFTPVVKQHKPSVIIGVPRLYEKSYQRIVQQINSKELLSKVTKKAIEYGSKKENRKKLQYKVYDALVYRKIRNTLGGNLRFMISGGAALNPKVGMFFDASGVPVLEGYGLTEYSPIVSVNKPDDYKIGTVGHPLPNTSVRIADDGEVLIKGPGIMKGYYGNGCGPQLILDDGWFKTGDLGEMDEEGYLKIIGRKKEVIVLSTGKNVSPRTIEAEVTLSKYIKQAAVVGDDKKHIAALIVPDYKQISRKFGLNRKREIVKNKEIRKFIQAEINKQLKGFSRHEQIKKFELLRNEFTKDNRFLNDDSSINRDKIGNVYREAIDKLYSDINC
ncbi:MAG: long-chain fatty acid--CoA ligase [Actinobacteria bacterium]|nr:MAG: long-chain fatty acid--CoA ligase [Actinomycetota bacterium]